MGRPRRAAPLARCQAWLRLCQNNDSLKKLIPIYFPQSTLDSSSINEINFNSSLLNKASSHSKKRKFMKKSPKKLKIGHVEKDSIDEIASQIFYKSVNYDIIRDSLNMSSIHWKAMPQYKNISKKHLAAVCGVIAHQKKHCYLGSASTKENSKRIINETPPFVNSELAQSIPQPEIKNIKTESTILPPPIKPILDTFTPFCRYCGNEENITRITPPSTNYICNNCTYFLQETINNLKGLEDAICIQTPFCRLEHPIRSSENTKEKPFPIPDQWCSACKLFHCIKIGYRPPGFNRKNTPNDIIKNLIASRLSQPKLVFWAQQKRFIDFTKNQRDLWLTTNQVNIEENVTESELIARQVTFMLDKLWVRATHLNDKQGNSIPETSKKLIVEHEPMTPVDLHGLEEMSPKSPSPENYIKKITAESFITNEGAISLSLDDQQPPTHSDDSKEETVKPMNDYLNHADSDDEPVNSKEKESNSCDVGVADSFTDLNLNSIGLNESPTSDCKDITQSVACVVHPSNDESADDAAVAETIVRCMPSSCLICAQTHSLYAVTMGPGIRRTLFDFDSDIIAQKEVKLCGDCLTRCRKTATKVIRESNRNIDGLCEWFCARKLLKDCDDKDAQHLTNILQIFLEQLVNDDANTFDKPGNFLLATGSPLFFYLLQSSHKKSKDGLFSRKLLTEECKNDKCLVCNTHSNPKTALFKLNEGTVVCQTCISAYKTVLSVVASKSALRPLSTRITTVLSTDEKHSEDKSSLRKHLLISCLDVAPLATILATPCAEKHGKEPLWALCLACHTRRCLRLLDPLEPALDLPRWLRRRARLTHFHELADFDPRLCLMRAKKKKGYVIARVEASFTESNIPQELNCQFPGKIIDIHSAMQIQKQLPAMEANVSESHNTLSSNSCSSSYNLTSEEEEETVKVELMPEEIITGEAENEVLPLTSRRNRKLTTKAAEALEDAMEERRRKNVSSRGNFDTPQNTTIKSFAVSIKRVSHRTTLETEENKENPQLSSDVNAIVDEHGNSKTKKTTETANEMKNDKEDKMENEVSEEMVVTTKTEDITGDKSTVTKKSRIKQQTPNKIIEGKRKSKVNTRLQDDFDVDLPVLHSHSSKNRDYSFRRSTSRASGESSDASNGARRYGNQQKHEYRKPGRKPRNCVDNQSPHRTTGNHGPRVKQAGRKAIATAEADGRHSSEWEGRHSTDCGKCPACLGLIKPCGRCSDCRKLVHFGGENAVGRRLVCKDLICLRRRPMTTSKGDRPRVKLPSDFSPRSYQKALTTQRSPTNGCRPGPAPSPSLLDTVPGLQEQLISGNGSKPISFWRPPLSNNSTIPISNSSTDFSRTSSTAQLEVFADAPTKSLRGGDLGMHFGASDSGTNRLEEDKDRIRPVEGEVIDTDLAYHGGYPIVTTLAAAPPKEICFACGSGGGQLLFCVSCAEPFHFYCVERQFRPRSKDHFVCRNCTPCTKCKHASTELKCVRCNAGYHPGCLVGYAPAQSSQRWKWVCPDCTHCLHCLVKPRDKEIARHRTGGNPAANMVPWSVDPAKCADCHTAEENGQICPECDRAYLQDTMEMVQCDSCQLWRHRACAKLTTDQYELIAQLPSSQLRPFTIFCSVCKRDTEVNRGKCNNGSDEKLRQMARDTLLERMHTLLQTCRRSPNTHNPNQPQIVDPIKNDNDDDDEEEEEAAAADGEEISETSETLDCDLLPLKDHHQPPSKGGALWNLPQVDGGLDSPPHHGVDESISQKREELFLSPLAPPPTQSIVVSAVLVEDDVMNTSLVSTVSNSSTSGAPTMSVPATASPIRDEEDDDYEEEDEDGKDNHTPGYLSGPEEEVETENEVVPTENPRTNLGPVLLEPVFRRREYPQIQKPPQKSQSAELPLRVPAWKVRTDLSTPPMIANWLVQDEFFECWTTPRCLAYSLLARLLHRLSCTLTTSHDYVQLRHMLQWLSNSIEQLFPWLPATENVEEVRSLLRQAHGSIIKVMAYLRMMATLELHELACSHAASLLEETRSRLNLQRLYNSASASAFTCVPVRSIAAFEECASRIQAHVLERHPEFQCCLPMHPESSTDSSSNSKYRPHQHRMSELETFVRLADIRPQHDLVDCYQPHKLQKKEENWLEVRDERWIEHWSKMEDRTAIYNFQKDIFLRWQSILNGLDAPSNKASPSKTTSDESPGFYFAISEYWEALLESYSSHMRPIVKKLTHCVDLDESDPEEEEQQNGGIYALPPSVIAMEQKRAGGGSDDPRRCLLCANNSDDSIEGRLLYTGSDTWIHVNCALWSNEVYEEESGQLAGLSAALRRGGRTRCTDCGQLGATMTCLNGGGKEKGSNSHLVVVHFACALRRNSHTGAKASIFTGDRSWFCCVECRATVRRQRLHDAIKDLQMERRKQRQRFHLCSDDEEEEEEYLNIENLAPSGVSESEIKNLARQIDADLERIKLNDLLVCRRVFIPSDCFSASLSTGGEEDEEFGTSPMNQPPVLSLALSTNTLGLLHVSLPSFTFVITIGALRVDRLGHIGEASDSITPTQSSTNINDQKEHADYLCPIGYRARRIYWSSTKLDSRIAYVLNVNQVHQPKKCYPSTPKENQNINKSRLLNGISNQTILPSIKPLPSPCRSLYTESSLPRIPAPQFSAKKQLLQNPQNWIRSPSIQRQVPYEQQLKPQLMQDMAPKPLQPIKQLINPSPQLSPIPVVSQHFAPQLSSGHPIPRILNTVALSVSNVHSVNTTMMSQALQKPSSQVAVYSVASPSGKMTTVGRAAVPSLNTSPNNATPTPPRPIVSTIIGHKRTSIQAGLPSASVTSALTNEPKRFTLVSSAASSSQMVPNHVTSPHQVHFTNSLFVTSPLPVITSTQLLSKQTTQSRLYTSTTRPSNQPQQSVFLRHQGIVGGLRFQRIIRPTDMSISNTLPHQHQPITVRVNTMGGVQRATLIPKMTDANLALQIDGLFNNIVQPVPRQISIGSPLMAVHQTTQNGQSVTLCTPQISQLDGIDDRQLANTAASGGYLKRRSTFDDTRSNSSSFSSSGRVNNKKKWILDKESRQQLKESIQKARQAVTDRLYQKEIVTYADAFQLQFSIDKMVQGASSPRHAWQVVAQRVHDLRTDRGIESHIYRTLNGWSQFGLNHRHIVFLTEQLPGAFNCYRYQFRYYQHSIDRLRETFSPPIPVKEGCARLMPCDKAPRSKGKARDPLAFLCCRSNPAPQTCLSHEIASNATDSDELGENVGQCLDAAREAATLVANSLNLPSRLHAHTVEAAVAEAAASEDGDDDSILRTKSQFSLTYQLKNQVSNREARLNRLAVHPSRIHKRGLFSLRAFRPDEVICEYTGELIRNIICERRETKYQAADVDCYMFRINNDWVIDATYAGNFARFINHSCQPNCDAKVVNSGEIGHIVIIAKRRIIPGEELTYDYRFPKEADKLLCNCGRIGCRKYLN